MEIVIFYKHACLITSHYKNHQLVNPRDLITENGLLLAIGFNMPIEETFNNIFNTVRIIRNRLLEKYTIYEHDRDDQSYSKRHLFIPIECGSVFDLVSSLGDNIHHIKEELGINIVFTDNYYDNDCDYENAYELESLIPFIEKERFRPLTYSKYQYSAYNEGANNPYCFIYNDEPLDNSCNYHIVNDVLDCDDENGEENE